ncbi:MAG: sigma-70 family RNA polymerase sigma factor, partial [Planctomycetota bacterium]|nr:sigma-70 family RNA polymerase sigma factor [Planctomycetota bacterium]
GQYRGQGSVRQWMAAIVAGKSLDVLREKRRLAVEGNFERMENLSREGEEEEKAGGEIERGEIAMALRDAIERLSDESQRLLALHYGAGMTHEQISEALGMPRRTVSWKLERSLDRLRGMLERAGFAAAAPIIGGEGMAEAIFSGYEAPSAVRDRLLSKLARPSARSARPYRNGRFAAGAKKHRSPHGWRFRPSLFR